MNKALKFPLKKYYEETYYKDAKYRQYRGKKKLVFNFTREKEVLKLTEVQEEERILELGCGFGTFVIRCAELGAETTGTDISYKAIKLANELFKEKSRKKKPRLAVANIDHIPFKNNYFDKVIYADVTEHLADNTYMKSVKESHRTLKDGGKIIIYTPCPQHIFEILKKRNVILKEDKSHIGLRNMDCLIATLEVCGFKIVKNYFRSSHIPIFKKVEFVFMHFPAIGKYFRRRICILAEKV